MRLKFMLGLVAAIATTAVLISSAGAGASTSMRPHLDLSTHAGIAHYLKSIGVDARGVVVQRGQRNYAGPSCPGRLWHCTRARHVVQIAAAGGNNSSQCSDASNTGSGGIDEGGGCTIVQVTTNGTNDARCIEQTTTSPAVFQGCTITQTNTTGDNHALVVQKVKQSTGPSQSAQQFSSIDQGNLTGTNDAKVTQDIDQHTNDPGDQSQDASQASCVQQHLTAPSDETCLDTFDTGTGKDSSDVNQKVSQDAHTGLGTNDQSQNSDITGHVNQETTGLASNHNDQHEHQNETGKATFQEQSGPMLCCSDQGTNPGDKFEIHQDSDQHANANAGQFESMEGTCFSSGNCHVEQNANQNGAHEQNSCSAPSCFVTIDCTSGNVGDAPTTTGACVACPSSNPGCDVGCEFECFTPYVRSHRVTADRARPQLLPRWRLHLNRLS